MQVSARNETVITFNAAPLINATSFIEDRLLLNKAILDGARDASIIIKANNKNEREERARKAAIVWITAFLTPFITLPATNRLAMKYIAKLTPKLLSTDSNLIHISNKYLQNKELLKEGMKLLEIEENTKQAQNNNILKKIFIRWFKEEKTDYSKIVEKCGGDYELLRKKLINAKMSVLAFDFLFTTALTGSVGFINRWITRKKTGQDGFSAEFNMADKDVVEKRAEKFKKTEKLRNSIFPICLLLLTASPLLLRKGLLKNSGKLGNFAQKYAEKFDYDDGKFMRRLPFLFLTLVCDIGQIMSVRNETEVKDQAIRLSATQAAFFGGDIIIGSALASVSDKLFNTELLDKNCKKNWINKIIPPIKPIRDLQGRNKSVATGLFWVNMLTLFAILGIGIPNMLNKMIKHDVDKDANNQNK